MRRRQLADREGHETGDDGRGGHRDAREHAPDSCRDEHGGQADNTGANAAPRRHGKVPVAHEAGPDEGERRACHCASQRAEDRPDGKGGRAAPLVLPRGAGDDAPPLLRGPRDALRHRGSVVVGPAGHVPAL